MRRLGGPYTFSTSVSGGLTSSCYSQPGGLGGPFGTYTVCAYMDNLNQSTSTYTRLAVTVSAVCVHGAA
jgi:hypothetical protein